MKQLLEVIYILPSHYDDEGYVHRYWRAVVPSNTLCCLKSLTEAVAETGELPEDVELRVSIYDDRIQRIPVRKIIRRHQCPGTQVLVGFVGVQSNQFPRASDLALELREGGVPVMIGGFHVSGVLAVLGEPSIDLQRLLDRGVTLVKGEAEAPGIMARILRDALAGELQPIYDIAEPPDLTNAPVPTLDPAYMKRFATKTIATVDTSRGCPFRCSFCTIINVQGKRMRCRSAEAILRRVRESYDAGVNFYFFTDDNLSRSPVWPELFEGLAAMRAEGIGITFMMQIDTQAYLIPGFVEKAHEAGCRIVFVGMESVNPDNLAAAGKVQNDTESYVNMVKTWHDVDVLVHVGYIIGFPYDSRESVHRDVAFLRDTIQVDEVSFFMLIPLPGSEDHKNAVRRCVPIDADLNNYDSHHETFRHSRMEPGEWKAAYNDAWDAFYSKENITNILLRTPRHKYWYMFWILVWYRYTAVFARVHPMEGGLFRFKDRKSRRPIFAREGCLRYAWRRLQDLYWGTCTYARLFFEFQEIWMLTRKPQDPRWATLADLREKWAAMQQQIATSGARGQCEAAAQEVRAMLAAGVERLRELSRAQKGVRGPVRRRLARKAQEAEAYLKSFSKQLPTWAGVVRAQTYVSDGLVAGYEELAIRYVAQRRRFNAYRQDLLQRFRTGRILGLNISTIPAALVFELVVGLRFWYTAIVQGF